MKEFKFHTLTGWVAVDGDVSDKSITLQSRNETTRRNVKFELTENDALKLAQGIIEKVRRGALEREMF